MENSTFLKNDTFSKIDYFSWNRVTSNGKVEISIFKRKLFCLNLRFIFYDRNPIIIDVRRVARYRTDRLSQNQIVEICQTIFWTFKEQEHDPNKHSGRFLSQFRCLHLSEIQGTSYSESKHFHPPSFLFRRNSNIQEILTHNWTMKISI